jgi:tRNA A-37 threonylcarbamoyl transferase component Bud32
VFSWGGICILFFAATLAALVVHLYSKGHQRRQVPSRRADLDSSAFRKQLVEDIVRDAAVQPHAATWQAGNTPKSGLPKGVIYGGLVGLILLVLIVGVAAIAATQTITDPSVAKTAILSIVIGSVVCVLIIGVVVVSVAGILWGDKYVSPPQQSAASEPERKPVHSPVPAPVPLAGPRQCPVCGEMIPDDSPEGLCPKCILGRCMNVPESPVLSPKAIETSSYDRLPAAPPSELATKFAGLEILELLGQGGMGAVYKARQTKLDRLVAVKVLPPEWGKEPAFAERFAREAKALARLGHPNIVAVHDFGESDGLYYLVMEYVDGANLRNILQAGRLEPGEALAIIPQICEALHYAHGEGIVHRDIKPENILLDSKGRVKIADFGLAKLLGRSRASFTLTGTHQVMGTIDYMAPEQRNSPQEVDHRADIYSLGVVFYEMLTGELPLGRFAPPSQSAGVDERLDRVVFKALEREPGQRYQRVSEVKTDLEAIAAARLPGGAVESAAREQPVGVDGITFSFKLQNKWGIKYNGVARLEADVLVLEYDTGVFKSEWREKRIQLSDIRWLQFKRGGLRGLFTRGSLETVLSFRVMRPSMLDGVPARKADRLDLHVAGEDADSARRFASALKPSGFVGSTKTRERAAPAPVATIPRQRGLRGFFGSIYSLMVHSRVEHEVEPEADLAALRVLPAGPRQAPRSRVWIIWLAAGGAILLASLVALWLAFSGPRWIGPAEEDDRRPQVVLKKEYEGLVTTLDLHENTLPKASSVAEVFRATEEEYLALESRFTKRQRDDAGHLKVTILPFRDKATELEKRFWAKLVHVFARYDGSKTIQARKLLPKEGELFPFGQEEVRIEIQREGYWFHGRVYRGGKATADKPSEEFDGPQLPAMYERFWAD